MISRISFGCAAAVLALSMTRPVTSVVASSKAKERGAALFATRGCAHCHGPAGVGGAKGPDLQLVRKRMNKAQIREQIMDGGKSMPEFGDMLTSPEISDLVAYLRARRKVIVVTPKPIVAAPKPAAASSDPD
jgi:mono/diheme cytochrome c family protein